jgi:hypothetical protein
LKGDWVNGMGFGILKLGWALLDIWIGNLGSVTQFNIVELDRRPERLI